MYDGLIFNFIISWINHQYNLMCHKLCFVFSLLIRLRLQVCVQHSNQLEFPWISSRLLQLQHFFPAHGSFRQVLLYNYRTGSYRIPFVLLERRHIVPMLVLYGLQLLQVGVLLEMNCFYWEKNMVSHIFGCFSEFMDIRMRLFSYRKDCLICFIKVIMELTSIL